MKRVTTVGAIAVAACLLMGAADGSWLKRVPGADRARTNPLADQQAAAQAGSHLYSNECSKCHGERAQGRGNRPTLISERMKTATDGELAWLLRNGNSWKGMPSWSSMPEGERWQLVAYMRSLNAPAAVAEPKSPEGAGK